MTASDRKPSPASHPTIREFGKENKNRNKSTHKKTKTATSTPGKHQSGKNIRNRPRKRSKKKHNRHPKRRQRNEKTIEKKQQPVGKKKNITSQKQQEQPHNISEKPAANKSVSANAQQTVSSRGHNRGQLKTEKSISLTTSESNSVNTRENRPESRCSPADKPTSQSAPKQQAKRVKKAQPRQKSWADMTIAEMKESNAELEENILNFIEDLRSIRL